MIAFRENIHHHSRHPHSSFFTPAFIAEHGTISCGAFLWSVWTSCPRAVLSQPPVPPWLLAGRAAQEAEASLGNAAQQQLKHWGVITTVFISNANKAYKPPQRKLTYPSQNRHNSVLCKRGRNFQLYQKPLYLHRQWERSGLCIQLWSILEIFQSTKNMTKINVKVPFSTSSLVMTCLGLLPAVSAVILCGVCHVAAYGMQCLRM